jgi:uncharacterized protein YbaR (Trm112 family)
MNVTYACPSCQQTVRSQFSAEAAQLACPRCSQPIEIPDEAVSERRIARCLVCPSTELFIRKDFPQRLGVTLVIVGFVASSIAWYNYQVLLTFAILFVTALVDLVLYISMGESLMCYRCGAQYRGIPEMDTHGAFDLSTHERYRQMAARMKETKVGSAAPRENPTGVAKPVSEPVR